MHRITILLASALAFVLGASLHQAQAQAPSAAAPVTRDPGGVRGTTSTVPAVATRTWAELVRANAKPTLRIAPPAHLLPRPRGMGYRELGSPAGPMNEAPVGTPAPGTALPPVTVPITPKLTSSFVALDDLGTSFLEPDATAAVGPDEIMVLLEDRVRIQDRQGGAISTIDTETFWAPTGSTFPIHATIHFDQLAGRWIACAAYPLIGGSRVLFAISSTSKASGSWTYYSFPSDPTNTSFANVTRMGFNSKWIAFTCNNFDSWFYDYVGAGLWVIDKASALVPGGPVTITAFYPGFDSDPVFQTTGYSMVPATTHDAAEETLWIIDSNGIVSSTFPAHRLSSITGTGPAPVWDQVQNGYFPGTGLFVVKKNYSIYPPLIPQLGTTSKLVPGEAHILDAELRNGRLWYTHMGGTPYHHPLRTAAYWYEINPSAPLQSNIVQSGAVESNTLSHAIPSIAVNERTDVMLGFTRCGASIFPEAAFAYRLASDPPGTIRPVQQIKAGENSYDKPFYGEYVFWSNCSATEVDPLDDLSMWTLQQYGAFPDGPSPNRGDEDRWGTWWGKLAYRALCQADVDADGIVGAADFNILARHFGSAVTPEADGDLNGDGVVDIKDFLLFAGDFGCGSD